VTAAASAPSAPSSGDVWILTGLQSSAPLYLGRYIALYPRAVYQYVSGSWTAKNAYVFTASAWHEVTLSIYAYGVDMLATLAVANQGNNYATVTIQKYPAEINFLHTGYGGRWIWTDAALDLTDITAAKIKFTGNQAYDYLKLLAIASAPSIVGSGEPDTAKLAAYTQFTSGTNATVSLNVSAFSGPYYLGVYIYGPTNYIEHLYAAWLER